MIESETRVDRRLVAGTLLALRRQPIYLVTSLALLCYVVSLNSSLYYWGDDAHYMIVANSVADGHGLRDVLFRDEPVFPYPIPLFPLVLAPIVAVSGYALLPPKILVLVTAVGTVYWTYRLFCKSATKSTALLVAIMTAVSPQIVSFSHQVMTEVPYLLVSLMALFVLLRYAQDDHWRRRSGVVCALLLVAAVLLRSVGFTLVVAAVAHLMLEGRHAVSMRLRKAVLIGVVCSISWLGVNYSTLGQIPYVSEFREGAAGEQADGGAPLGERVRTNLSGYREAAPEVVIYHLYRRPRPLLASLLIAVTGLGLAAAVIRRRTVIEYYAVTYGLLLLLYPPSNTGNLRRYLVPIIPFVLYYFVLGVRLAAGTLRHALHRFGLEPITARRALDWGRRVTFGAIVLLALANLVETTRASVLDDVPEMFDYSMYGDFEGYRAMATWAKTHTPTDSVVAVEEVYDFAFWSHRHVDWYPALPSGADERTTVARFLEADVSYVAVDGLDESPGSQSQLVRDALARSPDFVVVYRKRDNVLYRVVG